MANIKTFMNNGKTIATANGKMQFNTANAQFRVDMQYRFDAKVQYADKAKQAKANIDALKAVIEFKNKQPIVSSDEIDSLNADIVEIQDGLKALKKEFEDNAPAITVEDENLFLAYRDMMNNREDVKNGNTYFRAFCEWANSKGLVPTEDTFKYISKHIGAKMLSATAIVKNNGNKFTGNLNPNQFYNLFYAKILEILKERGLLRSYEFQYKFPVKEKKSK